MNCDNLDDDIQAHKGTLSPLRRMPIELLSLIFVFGSRFKYLEPPPWTASQVCHLWRTVALSQSSFWATINLDFERTSEMDRKTSTPFRLKAQLKRSGTLPLCIDFACRYKFGSAKPELVLLDILAQHSTRWETVRLFGPLYMFNDLACIRGNLPLLCKLQVLCHPPDPDDEHTVDVFEFAPNLRDVIVNMEGFHEDPVRILLPFPGLQQYAARDTLDSQLRTLASASNLVECALDIDDSSDISVPPTKLVALPHLLRLFLLDSKLLDCLDTPQLEELILHLAPTITDLGVCVPAESFDELNTSLILRNEPTDVGLALRLIVLACNERLGQIFEFDMRDERLDELESERLVFTPSPDDAHIGMVPEHLQLKSSYW
ncbi:hypothetical protein DFH08DRAFT_974568 [Mycena albidolilacea]|uniref:F-box domain-containing protein n=1 Tax=Mycena albidolilacea TaxID=1033008 RepID=A0AAD6Z700_9AGAR|nr:hypothetical protein DFH08DRAFT_974568 [Mycena albidolilacea]